MQHGVALQGVVGLCHLSLSSREHVARLCIVHLGNQLAAAHSLSFPDQHALHHAHAGETDGRSLVLFHDAHIRLSVHAGTCRHHFGRHSRRGFLSAPRLLFLSAAADKQNRQQQQNTLSHCYFVYYFI